MFMAACAGPDAHALGHFKVFVALGFHPKLAPEMEMEMPVDPADAALRDRHKLQQAGGLIYPQNPILLSNAPALHESEGWGGDYKP